LSECSLARRDDSSGERGDAPSRPVLAGER
jgi:hypothetical protein